MTVAAEALPTMATRFDAGPYQSNMNALQDGLDLLAPAFSVPAAAMPVLSWKFEQGAYADNMRQLEDGFLVLVNGANDMTPGAIDPAGLGQLQTKFEKGPYQQTMQTITDTLGLLQGAT